MTVKAPERNILLTRESGLKPLKIYKFEVRARNAGYEGNWSEISEYIGMSLLGLEPPLPPQKKTNKQTKNKQENITTKVQRKKKVVMN